MSAELRLDSLRIDGAEVLDVSVAVDVPAGGSHAAPLKHAV